MGGAHHAATERGPTLTRVGFLGPGRMGRPMVDRLQQAGHDLTVQARRPELREELDAAGVRSVASAQEAVDGAEVVLVCLFSDDQLADVADDLLAGLAPGAVVASHVTGSRTMLHELDERVRGRGAVLVDAPVSGGEEEIRVGRLTVLLGGADEAVAEVDAVVSAYADPRVRTGPLGSALAVKLVNNLLFAAHVQTAASAIALAERLGVPQATLVEVLRTASGGSYAAARLGAGLPAAQWADVVGEFLRKDVAACEDDLRREGVDVGALGEVVRQGPIPLTRLDAG